MWGTYVANKKFDSIKILLLYDSTNVLERPLYYEYTILYPKLSFSILPLKEVEKKNKNIASLQNFTRKNISTRPSLYFNGYGSCGFPEISAEWNSLRKLKVKIKSPENFTRKKMSTGPSLYYDWYGSCGFPEISAKWNTLRNLKKNCVSREFCNEENEHRTKFLLWRVRKLWFPKKNFWNKTFWGILKKKTESLENVHKTMCIGLYKGFSHVHS